MSDPADTLYGAVEAGGTKFVCLIGAGPTEIVAETRVYTTTPAETIQRVTRFFRDEVGRHPVRALGVGSFGPIDLDPVSPAYGHITTTPKPGWAGVDLCGPLRAALGVPVAFDTDVNAAAFGEHCWVPENRGLDPLLYLTVGTGIGLGGIVNSEPLHGLLHSEAGHMMLPHDRAYDPFPGACPYHGDCWEGLASGPALERRWGRRGETLPPDHPAWALEAHYLGLGIANLIYCFSPRRVVIGGGVMQQPGLIERVRAEVRDAVNGYLASEQLAEGLDRLIVAPSLGVRAGVLGALALAAATVDRQPPTTRS